MNKMKYSIIFRPQELNSTEYVNIYQGNFRWLENVSIKIMRKILTATYRSIPS